MALRQSIVLAATLLCLTSTGASALAADEAEAKVDFVRQIKPLLQKHCVECHGAEAQEGGLRLDLRSVALEGGDSGYAIVPGKSAEGALIERVTSDDPELRMPPEGDPLSADEIARLKRWVEQGADWPASADDGTVGNDHWAYQTIAAPQPPLQATGATHPIDAFVRTRLKTAGLQLSAEADRYTLIRRLYLDLLGLLPSIEEVDAFVNDASPDAYEKLVDRLLQSPHFGERWGRHWLDLARYADSDGYEKDRTRPNAWRWRDWVIDAVNRDMPFDQFTVEQLAGDLLPDATDMQRLATAFHRQTLTNTEGGTDQEQFRVEACFDRVETTGTVWLGLTLTCARCHSHKYDAISQREYYRLFAFFNNGDETNTNVPISDEALAKYEADKADWSQKLSGLQQELAEQKQQLGPALAEWEAEFRSAVASAGSQPIDWQVLEFQDLKATSKSKFVWQDDGSYLLEGNTPDKDEYTLELLLPDLPAAMPLSGLKLETIPDERLPSKGAGRAPNGNFVLSSLRVYAGDVDKLTGDHAVTFNSATADFSQDKFPPELAIDSDKAKTGWAVSPQMTVPHVAEFLFRSPVAVTAETRFQVVLDQQYGGQHTIGRFRVSLRLGTDPRDGIPADVLAILDVDADQRSETQTARLTDWFATRHDTTATLIAAIDKQKAAEPKKPYMQVRVVTQRASNPRTTHVFRRGEFLEPLQDREIIPAGLTVLPELHPREQASRDRLDLARWLVSEDNPLTSRVTVNHVWKHLFGRGIVPTVNDFGVRGEAPTHPLLLDWLANEFRSTLKWSRKDLIRLIVTSATYRQNSSHRADLQDADPTNLLFGRQNRLRAEAEIVRDMSLSVSGLLSQKVGGPSVFPPLPPGVAELSYAGNFKWKTSAGEDRYRRGMYTFFKRTSPHPNLTSFDCPDANTTCFQRQASNTPLQALILLNNEVFTNAAHAFAKRLLAGGEQSDRERLEQAFRLCVARLPSDVERDEIASLLLASRDWYKSHDADTQQLAGNQTPDGLAPAEYAAWIATSRILLNMDEFITRN
ncbi:MAG: PSD1 and planctomycete cytochrome C domain-containing protein [Planctomycetota bacterium]